MKTKRSMMLIIGLTVLIATVAQSQITGGGVVGYKHQELLPGDNLISNPFDSSPNLLSTLIPTAPFGTTVSLWNPTTATYDTTATYLGGLGWSSDFTIALKTGALLNTAASFTNHWAGNVLDGDGIPYSGSSTPTPPSAFSGPAGTYLLGTIAPIAVSDLDVFLYTLGRNPDVGEKVTTLDPSTQIYTTTTYLGSGSWDNGTPSLEIAESAFFEVIPEPSSVALLGLFSLGIFIRRRFFY